MRLASEAVARIDSYVELLCLEAVDRAVVESVKDATKILLDPVDYFTILLTGISGIFVNNLPLSS